MHKGAEFSRLQRVLNFFLKWATGWFAVEKWCLDNATTRCQPTYGLQLPW